MKEDYVISTHTKESVRTRPTKAPFGYFGSKQRIASQIIQLLPPHHAWVEGFCGSAALTLAKLPVPIEVINDADGQIVNLFEQLRNNTDELCRAVALTPYSREEFQLATRCQKGDIDPLEKARKFLVATMMAVNSGYGETGSGFSFTHSYARQGKEARVNRWYNLPERLECVVERLRGIRIENRDARELIDMFIDRPASLIYLDPPYFMKRGFSYVVDANNLEFHVDLLDLCKKARCMIIISGYENKLYEDTLTLKEGWHKHTIETHTRNTCGKNYARKEILWMNKHFVKARATGRVPILLKENEKIYNKINPSRKRR